MTKDESPARSALKLALEALELSSVTVDSFGVQRKTQEAITAIREALAEPSEALAEQLAHCEAGPDYCQQCQKEYLPTYGSEEVRKLREVISSQAAIIAKFEQTQQKIYGYVSLESDKFQFDEPEIGRWVRVYTTPPAQPQQEPVAWINWCAATGKRSVSFVCESELASQPLYEGITQNTQYHYSKFHSWFDSELHRQKYTKDHPAYLAAQEAWNAANDAAQHRINRLNAEIEAWKVRFKIAEDALAKLNGKEKNSD